LLSPALPATLVTRSLCRIASGAMFGSNQPVILHLVEIEPALPRLNGVVMELDDCAFPLLKGVVATGQPGTRVFAA